MAMSLYELMSRSSDSNPVFIPYVDGLPTRMGRPIIDILCTEIHGVVPEVNARGQPLLRPAFERVKKAILGRTFGDQIRDPDAAADRCMAVKELISLCKCLF